MADYVAEGMRIIYKVRGKLPKGRVVMIFSVARDIHDRAVENADRLGITVDEYNQEAYIKGCFYMEKENDLYNIYNL